MRAGRALRRRTPDCRPGRTARRIGQAHTFAAAHSDMYAKRVCHSRSLACACVLPDLPCSRLALISSQFSTVRMRQNLDFGGEDFSLAKKCAARLRELEAQGRLGAARAWTASVETWCVTGTCERVHAVEGAPGQRHAAAPPRVCAQRQLRHRERLAAQARSIRRVAWRRAGARAMAGS